MIISRSVMHVTQPAMEMHVSQKDAVIMKTKLQLFLPQNWHIKSIQNQLYLLKIQLQISGNYFGVTRTQIFLNVRMILNTVWHQQTLMVLCLLPLHQLVQWVSISKPLLSRSSLHSKRRTLIEMLKFKVLIQCTCTLITSVLTLWHVWIAILLQMCIRHV